MNFSSLDGFGSLGDEVENIDLLNAIDTEIIEIGKRHMKSLLTVVKNQGSKISPERFHYICSLWGTHNVRRSVEDLIKKPHKTPLENEVLNEIKRFSVGDLYGIIRVSGKKDELGNSTGMFSDGELDWHSNGSGLPELEREPCIGLLASEGTEGSVTEFLQTVDAYDKLSSEWKSEIDKIVAIHSWNPDKTTPGLNNVQREVARLNLNPIDEVEIPLKSISPGGLIGLHFPFNSIVGFKNYSSKEFDEIMLFLKSQFIKEEYIYRHNWHDGDVIWMDQTVTLHRRPTKDCSKRVIYRVCLNFDFLTQKRDRPNYEILKNLKASKWGQY